MVNYAVLGLGLMGSAICFDLLRYDSSSTVLGFDIDIKKREHLLKNFHEFGDRFKVFPLNLTIEDKINDHPLVKILQNHGIKVVFGAIDYKFNYFLTEICIKVGCSFVDLGGNPSIVQKQRHLHSEAKNAGITVIPDLGLAPGMVNIIAAHGLGKFDKLHECHLRVGGLPQQPKTLLKYQQVFSIRGLTNEYLEKAVIIRERKKQSVASLSEHEFIEFPEPWGELEAFQTAGGSSSLPNLYENKINELTYKTIRYPGHFQYFRLLKDIGLLASEPFQKELDISPRDVIEHYLEKYLPKGEPDVVLVRITIMGEIDGHLQKHTYQLIDLMDPSTNYSAMARTTAYPTSIIGQFIAHGIVSEKGVVTGEETVPIDSFMDELKKRNITFRSVIN